MYCISRLVWYKMKIILVFGDSLCIIFEDYFLYLDVGRLFWYKMKIILVFR